MGRPICPKCKRLAVFVNSHKSGELRVRAYGCKQCGEWSLGPCVTTADTPRTRAVISNISRNASGRFVSGR